MRNGTTVVYITKVNKQENHTAKRWESQVGRCLLSYGLNELYGMECGLKHIERMPMGKPYLSSGQDIHFSISHSRDYVICAIGKEPCGIDIQFHKKVNLEHMAKRTFSIEEYTRFEKEEDQEKFFFERWVEKESFLKWTGEGLSKDMRTLNMTGHGQHIPIETIYSCALWAEKVTDIEIRYVDYMELKGDKGI